MEQTLFFGAILCFAILYAYYNGANDCANTIATIIGTHALSPITAVICAAIANAGGLWVAYLLGSAVAKTIGSGIILSQFVTKAVVLSGLIGAAFWAWFATWRGLPVSITHSLIGGVLGSGLVTGGMEAIAMETFMKKVVLGVVLAPTMGFLAAYTFRTLLELILFPFKIVKASANRVWRKGQIITGLWLAGGHGMNDGQNALGILALGMVAAGFSKTVEISLSMVILVGVAIALGTLLHGWKVIETTNEVARLEAADGFSAQISNAGVLIIASIFGMPVSTTHAAVASIAGAGGAHGIEQVNWSISRHIVAAWIMTVPITGGIGAFLHYAISFFKIF